MKRAIKFFTVVLVLGMIIHPSLARGSEATDQVRAAIDEVIEVLRDPGLKAPEKKAERRDKIREKVQKLFTFEDMAKRSLGKHWRKRTDEEKEEFVEVFGRLIENSYIGKLVEYSD